DESSRAFFTRSYNGDVGHRGGNNRRGESGNDAAEKKPANGRRKRNHDVIETESKEREEEDRAPTDPVRQNADHRREEKLHRRENRQKNAVPVSGASHVVV